MCGFVACVTLDGRPPEHLVARMLPALVHRGPDDSGTWHEANVALGFRRLSIIDLTAAGHQPMQSDSGRHCIVFNGEIYNYLELRRELQLLGHVFRSASDTEVLLHAYEQWGEACVNRLVGMWAFVIVDLARGLAFGSRDRFGIKPLFVNKSPGGLLIGSEIKALRAAMAQPPAINWATTASFLLEDRLDETSSTFFVGIESVVAAHSFTVDLRTGDMKTWRYWTLPEGAVDPVDAPQRYRSLFDDAIRLHARSDVPIAVHLSGGLDSTSIAAGLAALQRFSSGEPLSAICFVDQDFDESEQIDATVAATGARMHSLTMPAEDLWARLPTMLRAHDEPVHSMTALVSFCLMEFTQQLGIKVVLNGQGADETLAGYPSYFRTYWRELLVEGKYRELLGQVRRYTEAYGGRPASLIAREIRAATQYALKDSDLYRAATRVARRETSDPWMNQDFAEAHRAGRRELAPMSLRADLARSISISPLPIYLRVEDRNSMAHSIESRVPFLDHRLVEYSMGLPSSELLDGYWNKHLLRRAMNGRIPDVVRTRWKKFGFPTPAQRWMRGPLAGQVRQLLDEHLPRSGDMFSERDIRQDFEWFLAGKIDCAPKLFRLVQFMLWRDQVAGGT